MITSGHTLMHTYKGTHAAVYHADTTTIRRSELTYRDAASGQHILNMIRIFSNVPLLSSCDRTLPSSSPYL